MKKRRILTLILTVCLTCSLACGCAETEVQTALPNYNKEPSEIEKTLTGMDPSIDPEDYRGSVVKMVTWKDPWLSTDDVATHEFEQELGIEVEPVLIGQGDYVKTIAATIASRTQGDIFYEHGDFPSSLTVMQPLDAAMLDLSDPFWNQSIIKASTLRDRPYLVDSAVNVWSEIDVCVYNKHIFESAGLKTPKEYYAEGKWTVDNFRYAAQQVSKLGKDYMGAGILGEGILAIAGGGFFTYKDDRMTVSLDEHLFEVMDFFAEMKRDGIVKLDRGGFGEGKTGMAISHVFGLKRTGYFTQINPDHLGVTYLPVWKEGERAKITSLYRGWGLIDGAKNPVGAGLYLSYYLNNDRYDMETTFHNEDVAAFFFVISEEGANDTIYYHGPNLVKATGKGSNFHESWSNYAPDELRSYLESQRPVMNEMCIKTNEIIEQKIEQLKESEEN